MDVRKKLQQVPAAPGIYIMKGPKARVLYVGKAKNLRNRIKSYFQHSSALDARKSKMAKEVKDFDYVITKNELEALALEANFIKRTKPRYNIILRDDKNYPYLRLTVSEEWPKLEVVRKIAKNGSIYFGPYIPANSMWEMLKFIRRNFPLRTCRYNLDKPIRPCVQYQMGRCLAPCSENLRKDIDRDRYMEIVNEVKLFIKGEKRELLESFWKRMHRHSENLQFEDAAKIRDRLKSFEKVWESQRVISPELKDLDVIGLYRENQESSIFMLFIRNGMVIGQKAFFLKKLGGVENKELITSFIEQFYSKELPLPLKIVIPFEVKLDTQKSWLSKKKGGKIGLSAAKGKKESEVLNMALENARYAFNLHKKNKENYALEETLTSLKGLLELKAVPNRIEAVDVSNIAGSEAVGALVAWEDGNFIKDDYRLFKIKTVKGIDDFAMIEEIMGRYFKGLLKKDGKRPSLILIDGGKGQLASAVRAMNSFSLHLEIAAIAKAKQAKPGNLRAARTAKTQLPDRIYFPGKTNALPLKPFMASTHLLQRIRNEAHRFTINFHKKLRGKSFLESPLEKIKGIGRAKRLLLLRHFGSIDAIRKATLDEIASIKGIDKKTAELLKAQL